MRHARMLTVGLPVYNGGGSLGRALESLLVQGMTDFLVVISDNGSTDETAEVCREFGARDRRIRILREEVNRGPAWNFNRLLAFAEESRYFMWAAHDDVRARDFTSSCIDFLESHPETVLCGTAAMFRGGHGNLEGVVDPGYSTLGLDGVGRAVRFAEHVWWNSTFYGVYRAAALRGRRLEDRLGGDHVFLLELALAGGFHTLPEVRIWRGAGASSRGMKELRRTLGLRRSWPGFLREVPIYAGFFDAVERRSGLDRRTRSRLKRELAGVCVRRHGRRLWGRLRGLLGRSSPLPPVPA